MAAHDHAGIFPHAISILVFDSEFLTRLDDDRKLHESDVIEEPSLHRKIAAALQGDRDHQVGPQASYGTFRP